MVDRNEVLASIFRGCVTKVHGPLAARIILIVVRCPPMRGCRRRLWVHSVGLSCLQSKGCMSVRYQPILKFVNWDLDEGNELFEAKELEGSRTGTPAWGRLLAKRGMWPDLDAGSPRGETTWRGCCLGVGQHVCASFCPSRPRFWNGHVSA